MSLGETRRKFHTTPLQYTLRRLRPAWLTTIDIKGNSIVLSSISEIIGDGEVEETWREINMQINIKNAQNIKKLVFDVQSVSQDISNKGFGILIKQIISTFIKLEHLELRFLGSLQITDRSFEALGFQLIRSLANLKKLTLFFACCERITDKGLKFLASGMSTYLPHIQSLHFHFLSFSNITNVGIKVFLGNMGKFLVRLEKFGLHFACCRGINDKTLEIVGLTLTKHLTHLKELSLTFEWCMEMTDKGADTLASYIANLNQLQYLRLSFYENENVSIECKEKLEEKLSFVPQLEIY